MLTAFKKRLLETYTGSKTGQCIYLELLSKQSKRNSKKVVLEHGLHKQQHEPEKGMLTATSHQKDRSLDV